MWSINVKQVSVCKTKWGNRASIFKICNFNAIFKSTVPFWDVIYSFLFQKLNSIMFTCIERAKIMNCIIFFTNTVYNNIQKSSRWWIRKLRKNRYGIDAAQLNNIATSITTTTTYSLYINNSYSYSTYFIFIVTLSNNFLFLLADSVFFSFWVSPTPFRIFQPVLPHNVYFDLVKLFVTHCQIAELVDINNIFSGQVYGQDFWIKL